MLILEHLGKIVTPKFFNSSFWKGILNNQLQIPEPEPLPGATTPLPYFLLGDSGFGLHKNLQRPYAGTCLTTEKKVFNYRLTRAQRYVECTFGILSNKWRIFHRATNLEPNNATDIVKACVI